MCVPPTLGVLTSEEAAPCAWAAAEQLLLWVLSGTTPLDS